MCPKPATCPPTEQFHPLRGSILCQSDRATMSFQSPKLMHGVGIVWDHVDISPKKLRICLCMYVYIYTDVYCILVQRGISIETTAWWTTCPMFFQKARTMWRTAVRAVVYVCKPMNHFSRACFGLYLDKFPLRTSIGHSSSKGPKHEHYITMAEKCIANMILPHEMSSVFCYVEYWNWSVPTLAAYACLRHNSVCLRETTVVEARLREAYAMHLLCC